MKEKNKKQGMRLFEIFCVFFKIGAFTFGGGYAMISLIQREVVEVRNWIREEEALDIFAISQSCPGVLAINAATFVGNRVAGVAGGAAATLGTVLPSYLSILAVAYFYTQFRSNEWVVYAFQGIRATVGVLLIQAVVLLARSTKPNAAQIFVMIAAFIAVAVFDAPTTAVILAFAAMGLAYGAYRSFRERDGKNG
ncbi:MAG: chromate transporter [Eubacteriaceae bacterium]|nr:chromate transporter [Eubacteriaceae bacterium]